jgi:hypothetical protein
MIARVQSYTQDLQSARVTVVVIFKDEGGEVFREDRLTMRAGLSLDRLYYEAIRAAKQKCWEPEYIEAQEDVPRCEHGEPLIDFLAPCFWCRFEEGSNSLHALLLARRAVLPERILSGPLTPCSEAI